MKLAKKLAIASVGVIIGLAGVGLPSAAQALVFRFSYNNGTNLSSEGYLITTDTPNGSNQFTITNVIGSRTIGGATQSITGLIGVGGYQSNDNLLNQSQPFFTANGFSYTTSSQNVNVRFNNIFGPGTAAITDESTLNGSNLATANVTFQPEGVPEPSDIGGLALLVGMGGLMVRKFKSSQKVTITTAESKKETLVS
jgi:hypothetical protein